MKKSILLIVLLLACLAAGGEGAFGKTKEAYKEVVYALSPAPTCQNCVKKIKGNLRFEKGVKAIDVDLKEKCVKITYSPQSTTPEKLEKALEKIGYTAVQDSKVEDRQQCACPSCCK